MEYSTVVNFSTLAWAFGAGVLAAAPIGPVNAVAIRRGLIHRWTHTLSVGLGSALVETCYVALAFWGGKGIMEAIPAESLHRWVGLPAAGIVIIIALSILRRAIVNPQRLLASVRLERMRQRRATFMRDVLAGAGLTAINPATLLYWFGVGPAWLEQAAVAAGSTAVWYGIAAAVAGLASWFIFVTVLVRLRPQNVGPHFFRTVNLVCGCLLGCAGIALAVIVIVKLAG